MCFFFSHSLCFFEKLFFKMSFRIELQITINFSVLFDHWSISQATHVFTTGYIEIYENQLQCIRKVGGFEHS